jgi:DNA-binding CsgD family transcriptional regulator
LTNETVKPIFSSNIDEDWRRTMAATRATTIQQRQAIADLTSQGQSYQAVARQLGLSLWTVRKWARRAKRGGMAGLVSVMGRPMSGPMAAIDPRVRYAALRLKRQHPTWGAAYIRKKLSERPSLQGLALPEATSLWRYWRSFGDRLWSKRRPVEAPLPQAGVAHGVWQMDAKESVPRSPPASVVLTLWLSRMSRLGSGSLPAGWRSLRRRTSLSRSQAPSAVHFL